MFSKIYSRLLLVVAHPDDEILGCGGLLSLLSQSTNNFTARVLFICEGSSCRYNSLDNPDSKRDIALRENSARKALSLYGIDDLYFYNYPCGNLNSIPILSINKLIEAHMSDFMPTSVFTHYNNDCNNDHRIVSRSCDMALRPRVDKTNPALFHFEVQSSTEWNFSAPAFQPNFFLPLADAHLHMKLQAMSKYVGEYGKSEHPRGSDALTVLAKTRGLQCGSQFAEAFRLVCCIDFPSY